MIAHIRVPGHKRHNDAPMRTLCGAPETRRDIVPVELNWTTEDICEACYALAPQVRSSQNANHKRSRVTHD
jgi:hypothetical protein